MLVISTTPSMETHGAQPEFNAHLSVPHPDWEQIAKDRGDLEKRLDELYQKPIHEFRKVPYVPPPLPSNVPESGRDISISDDSVTVRDGASIRIRVYKPLNISKGHTLFLNIHGGGWTTGRPETEEWQNRLIAYRTKAIVVSVDYRLAPEFPFPYALNDCWDVFDWTRKNAESLRVDPTSIIIGGGSAGANVSTVLVQLARDRGIQGVTGQVLNIPVTCHPDHFPSSKYSYTSFERNSHAPMVNALRMRKFWHNYLPAADATPLASPLLGQLQDLPPTLIQVAGMDPLRDEGIAYAEALRSSGVDVTFKLYPGVPHAFYCFPQLSQSVEYMEAIIEWISKLVPLKKEHS